jgi:pimeloyl-ACP methyl ester carboxylesterase
MTAIEAPCTVRHKQVDVGEVRLHVAESGPLGAPLVVLLHRFREFWWSWRHQIRALADAGFHVLAPDLRGFHLSEKPRAVSAYRLDRLAADVAGLVRAHGASSAAVVGHDWGANVAWMFAQEHPSMITRLGIINVPHPRRSLEDGLASLTQLRKSWYFFFFQLPFFPEQWLSKNDFRTVRRFFEEDGMAPADARHYVDAARAAGDNLRAGVNYYRALMRQVITGTSPSWKRIETPTLIVWGERDRFIDKALADPGVSMVPRRRLEFIAHASHWVQHDAPERVNELLLDFLGDGRAKDREDPGNADVRGRPQSSSTELHIRAVKR